MADGRQPPVTLAQLRDMIVELREDVDSLRDDVGELGGELLHRSDSDRRCLRVILKLLRHLHRLIGTKPVRPRGAH